MGTSPNNCAQNTEAGRDGEHPSRPAKQPNVESVLWELRPYRSSIQSYLRHLVADLRRALSERGLDDVLVKERGRLGVDPSAFRCDYYDFLNKVPGAPSYTGQFMSQYSWAEPTRAALERMMRLKMR